MRTLFFITLTMLSVISFAEVYKWVDKDGKVHFGDGQPENEKTEKISVKATKPSTNKDEGFDEKLLLGMWESGVAGSTYVKFKIFPDGTFTGLRTDHGVLVWIHKGTWKFDGTNITWRYIENIPKLPDSIVNKPDVNKVITLDEKNFVLIEMSGKETKFVRVEK